MGTGELSGKPEEMLAGKTVDEAAYHPGESSNTPYHFMLLKPFPNILQLTSLRRRGNARSVSFGTILDGQFTISTQLRNQIILHF